MSNTYKFKGFVVCISLVFFSITKCAAATVVWVGFYSSSWSAANNWSTGTVPTATDNVQIGTGIWFNAPTLASGTASCASLTFGTIGINTLTVNGTLNVTGAITQSHNLLLGNVNTLITGSGTITCASLQIGDNIPPLWLLNITTLKCNIKQLTIAGDLTVNSVTLLTVAVPPLISAGILNNDAIFYLSNDGTTASTVTVGGKLKTVNTNPGSLLGIAPYSAITINNTGTQAAKLQLADTTAISIGNTTYSGMDFYVPGGGTGTCGVEYTYAGATGKQTIYTDGVAGLDNSPTTYQNIGFSGAGAKKIQSGNLLVTGDWTSAGGKVDAISNNPSVYFQGGVESLVDGGSASGVGVIFKNVFFQGSSTKTVTSGNFSICDVGILTMAGTASLNANGNVTLLSDSVGSASVATIPTSTSITGNMNVQRFIQGSIHDLSKRGYRLMTSPVYTGTVTTPKTSKVFDISYILNSTYVAGLAGGGFNSPNGINPTMYIYREDILPSNAQFTSGNWKGIAKINNTPVYNIGTQKRLTKTNIVDTTTTIPIGNSYLLYFVGNKTDNSSQPGTKTSAPYDYPESVTFTATGTLTTGTVNVRLWFKTNDSLSYTVLNDNSAVRGFCAVGNPYACTVNWEKLNRNSTVANSTIYGTNFPAITATSAPTIWMFNPTNKQYEAYQQSTTTVDTVSERPSGCSFTGSASNLIASGQGFMVRASAVNQKLRFREGAKTTRQPTASNLIKLLSLRNNDVPVAPSPLMRLRMSLDSTNTDEVLLSFADSAHTAFNENEDAEDLGGFGAQVSLSVLSSDSVKLAINRLPFPKGTQLTVPLFVSATKPGVYNLDLTEAKNLPDDYQVWLMDSYRKDSLDIKHNPNYKFDIYTTDPASYGAKRLSLVFRQDPARAMQFAAINATRSSTGALVNWKVYNDLYPTAFNVERSVDAGATFNLLGTVSSNNSGNYNITDDAPVIGINQYRVSFNANGKVVYSNIAAIDLTSSSEAIANIDLNVYPNPTQDKINLKINNNTSNSYSIKVLNGSGLLLASASTTNTEWQYDAQHLMPGYYIISVTDNKTNKELGKRKFLKQ